MQIKYTPRFTRCYRKLSQDIKSDFKKQMELFLEKPTPPFHPSLRIKGIQGSKGIFEMTITMGVRMSWQFVKGGVLLRNIGEHDEVLKNP